MLPASEKLCKIRPKKYICPVACCGKSYNRPSLLQQHIRSHTNERPFVCPEKECGKGFFRKSHLQVHQYTHNADKPLKCSICNKGFTTKQQLERHGATHKPKHSCPYGCSAHFDFSEDFTNHILECHLTSEIMGHLHANNFKKLPTNNLTPRAPPAVNSNFTTSSAENSNIDTSPSELSNDGVTASESSGADIPSVFNSGSPDNSLFSFSNAPSTKLSMEHFPSAPRDRYSDDLFHGVHCNELECAGAPPYESIMHLIEHYDNFHGFVPSDLFEPESEFFNTSL